MAPTEPLLPTGSVVDQSMLQARRAVLTMLWGVVLLLAAVAAERAWFSWAHAKASQRLARAQEVAATIRLSDQRMTTAAILAVHLGERRWVDAYDAEFPVLEAALTEARGLAPPEVGDRFDATVGDARERLYDMRESAFEAVAVGAADTARAIFEGDRYRHHTALLAQATAEVARATVAAAEADRQRLRARSLAAASVALLLTAGAGFTLWRRLTRRLEQSRGGLLLAEQRVQRLASRDLLTDLANRAALHDAMASALTASRDTGGRLAVMMVDLDRFKPVNDRHGHEVGDAVLREVSVRLRGCLREGDVCARYGGDEFVVIVAESADSQISAAVAARIVEALRQPMHCDGLTLEIGASIGIARFPDDSEQADDLLRLADSALYRAKRRGHNEICHYDAPLDQSVADRHALEQEIRDGIAAGQFVPWYQPVVALASREVQGVEMLCRWQHPVRGLLAPAQFIPRAEASGLIDDLLLDVLDRALADLGRFPAAWRLSINVAPVQMLDATLVPRLLQCLARHGTSPSRLDIELTETVLVRDTAAVTQVIQAMKDAGMTVSLDDFGTGYSSLSYLTEMRFDRIKIDRSFVRTLHDRQQSAAIVDAVLRLSAGLGLQVVAEGVETEADAQALRRMGCGLGQGYLFSRPMPADALLAQAAPGVPEAAPA
jgi:diguanylate cyclase (GGDEF)-like protein